jgi:30S ribosomal protein 3|tara:strand:- start:45 stop:398 length:354 start_codon:yes stop_codon:yes gene_type:complete
MHQKSNKPFKTLAMDKKQFRLKLKIAWFKNFLGLAIDQVSSNQQYSLTPYYFWPRTEAWEQLKLELDSKLWLTQEEKMEVLKTTGDVMNYWLSYRDTKTSKNLQEDFTEIEVLTITN